MAKDNQEIDPVSIEDEIKAVLASGEDNPEEATDDEEKGTVDEIPAENESGGEDIEQDSSGSEEDSEEIGEESDESGSEDDSEESSIQAESEEAAEIDESDKLEAPEHWAASDRETFNAQTEEAKEWLLSRHRDMEGNMTRKSQELASAKRQSDAVDDALSPYRQEFAAAGLDNAGAVRQLAHWHDSLKTGGKAAILQLASMYDIDLSEEDEYIDPNLASIKQELSALKNQTAQQQQAAQRDQQTQLERVIDGFVTETDETGKLKHPHFSVLQEDIIKMFNAGMAKDLPDAYTKALTFRPDLTTVKPAVNTVTKEDQLIKVKKAKKAATGIKSSGATKRKRADMTLEQEIEALM